MINTLGTKGKIPFGVHKSIIIIITDAKVDTLHTLVNMGNIFSVVVTVLGLKKLLPSINDSSLIMMIPTFHLFSHPTGSSIYGLPGPWCV